MFFSQLDGTIIAPTSSKPWGSGLLQWLEFTKLKGITVQGSGTIDGRGSVWWKESPYAAPTDEESRLLVPLNNTVKENPPVIITSSLSFLYLPLVSAITMPHNFFGR